MNLSVKFFALVSLALIAFAANSVIARMALQSGDIGPWSYTTTRLIFGFSILAGIVGFTNCSKNGSWKSALALLIYAGCFSLAYLSLPAGIGALILFAAVQITMISAGIINGERLGISQTFGTLAAFAGLVYLLNPGADAPSLFGAILMCLSGIGWGVYSLRGKTSSNPTHDTAGNFFRAAIIACVLCLPIFAIMPESVPTRKGIYLAMSSGAITSGLGYVIWYKALRHITAIKAGVAQLTVPALAAAGGILFLSEPLSWRFIISSIVILGGVVLATFHRSRKNH